MPARWPYHPHLAAPPAPVRVHEDARRVGDDVTGDGARLWVHDAEVVVTMDDARREIPRGGVLVRGRTIEAVGDEATIRAYLVADAAAAPTPGPALRRIDARGTVVLPGLVNGHHHLFQTLTRTVGTAQGLALFDWLARLYPIWGRLTPEGARVSAAVGLAELMLSGATTVADHLYLFPNGTRLDDTIEAARALGVRFHPTRGAMSLGASAGGLPPDDAGRGRARRAGRQRTADRRAFTIRPRDRCSGSRWPRARRSR